MTILVTGGTGFVGKRVCKMLLQENQKIRLVSRNTSSDFDDIVLADLSSDIVNKSAFDGVSTVIHLAGYTHDLRDSSEIEHLYRKVNVDATVRLAKLAVTKTGSNPLFRLILNLIALIVTAFFAFVLVRLILDVIEFGPFFIQHGIFTRHHA